MKKKFKNLNEVRKSIDNIDTRLVKLIAEREFYARQAVKFKTNKKQIIDRKRINIVLKRINSLSKKYKVNSLTVERIWKLMIKNFIILENRLFRKPKD
ncbi:MAG: chorismate mutase [Alphaproteobacteria bacterium]|nr:chorismate mutase [Alphaproteobacteria bacterium]|tara:strand:- start:1244 stop:1537 length:294 start_codon:yes stop_codon:yes gene_type:complete